MVTVQILDGLASGMLAAARDITFEYVALTQGEAGLPVPQDIQDLPAPLREMVDSLAEMHAPPGALLLAVRDGQLCATVAMRRSDLTSPSDAVVQRLYVREAYRRTGIAGRLMAEVHNRAASAGLARVVLNVMTTREGALALYTSLGYVPLLEHVDWPYGGTWLCYTVPTGDPSTH